MKTSRICLVSLLAALPLSTHAQIIVGDGEIALSASLATTYDSNFSAQSEADGGTYSTLSPDLVYNRNKSLVTTSLGLGMGIQRYFDNSELNQETYHANALAKVDRETLGNYEFSFSASYYEGSQANYDLGTRLRSKRHSLSGMLSVDTSERTGLDFDTRYNKSDSQGFRNQDTFSNSLDFRFGPFLKDTNFYSTLSNTLTQSDGQNAANTQLDQSSTRLTFGLGKKIGTELFARVNAGYNWHKTSRQEEQLGNGDSSGTVLSASLTGPFLPKHYFPKTTSKLSVSYSDSESRGINDRGGKSLTGSLDLGWQARENTKFSLGASRSRRLTVDDLSTTTTEVHLGVEETMTNEINLSANLGYRWNSFDGLTSRDQQSLFANATASRSFGTRRNWAASLSADFNDYDSDNALRNFSRYSLSALLSYTY